MTIPPDKTLGYLPLTNIISFLDKVWISNDVFWWWPSRHWSSFHLIDELSSSSMEQVTSSPATTQTQNGQRLARHTPCVPSFWVWVGTLGIAWWRCMPLYGINMYSLERWNGGGVGSVATGSWCLENRNHRIQVTTEFIVLLANTTNGTQQSHVFIGGKLREGGKKWG